MSEPIDLDVIEPDDMGIIMDALIEHAASSRKRKGVNSESLSDERAERCDHLILLLGRAITATTVAGLRARQSGGTVSREDVVAAIHGGAWVQGKHYMDFRIMEFIADELIPLLVRERGAANTDITAEVERQGLPVGTSLADLISHHRANSGVAAALDAGRDSRQAEVDALQTRIDRVLAMRYSAEFIDGWDYAEKVHAALTEKEDR